MRLFILALLACSLTAAEWEEFTLTDGRVLVGQYDPATGQLVTNDKGDTVIVEPGDIDSRKPSKAPVPTALSADEAAKVMADINAKKKVQTEAKASNEVWANDPEAARKAADIQRWAANKDADEAAGKIAKAQRDFDDYERKATLEAKNAMAQSAQFLVRARQENTGVSDKSEFRDVIQLKRTAGSNAAVLESVKRVKDLLEKRDEAALRAGIKSKPVRNVVSWIGAHGR